MIQSIWIFSKRHRWFNNGVVRVTEEVVNHYKPEEILGMLQQMDIGIVPCIDTFKPFEMPRPEWKPYTPEEIIRILS